MAGTTNIVEGFSISHAAILNGSTGAEQTWGDFYGVRSGSLAIDTDSFDNTGDESVMSTWYWFNFATVTIQGGYVPFSLLAGLSGTSMISSGGAGSEYYSIPLWNDTALNQPRYPMMIRVPSKDSVGNTRVMDFVLYSVQFEPFGFDGPTYKDGLVLNYSGKALMSSTDEKGTALSGAPYNLGSGARAIGRVIARPSNAAGTTYNMPNV